VRGGNWVTIKSELVVGELGAKTKILVCGCARIIDN